MYHKKETVLSKKSLMKNSLFYLTTLLFSLVLSAQQNTFDIYFPQSDRPAKCNYFIQAFQQKPKEVRFGIKTEGDNLYFEINDKQWFDYLFKESGDGIAVDIVSKQRYSCKTPVFQTQIKGKLLAPVYLKRLKKDLKKTPRGNYRALVGKIPAELKTEDLEFNILFLHNKSLCRYYYIYNLEAYPWDLLDMGVYLDELSFKNQEITTSNEKVVTKYKQLTFSIPFEKNKSEYKPEDIKPVYDSLRLTDFNIKKINIKAYASVEGSLERNIALQKQRANSIASSLQSFQTPDIETTISSSENWVEFLNDIKNTAHQNLIPLSKTEIKSKLTGNYVKDIEPILKHHRKAVIILSLERKDIYKQMSVDNLVTHFNTAIAKNQLDDANIIQNSILDRVKATNSPEILTRLQIPKQKKYITLLTKHSIIKYLLDYKQTLIVKHELESLEKIDPNNKRIKYNLAVLNFFIWRNRAKPVDEAAFKNDIINLKKVGIPQNLIDRMLVNYHIIKAEHYMRNRQYDEKDEALEFITDTYENFSLSDYDYLSLAQFLMYYANIYDAIDLLEDKVKDVTVNENLLFYYINLTITNNNLIETDAYRTTMLNAINMNKARFCKLFNAALKGGVTFQLLENIKLRTTYCENCTTN